jgi:hypothetical protein
MDIKDEDSLTLDLVPVLLRREIEARILGPIIEALCQRYPEKEVLEIIRRTIETIAKAQGEELRGKVGGNSLEDFKKSQDVWRKSGAVEIEVLKDTDQEYAFLVHRCLYAELYESLGLKKWGVIFSCMRDFPLIEGFNPQIKLERKHTIMEGYDYCDFRYFLSSSGGERVSHKERP